MVASSKDVNAALDRMIETVKDMSKNMDDMRLDYESIAEMREKQLQHRNQVIADCVKILRATSYFCVPGDTYERRRIVCREKVITCPDVLGAFERIHGLLLTEPTAQE